MLESERDAVRLVRRAPVLLLGGALVAVLVGVALAVPWLLARETLLPTPVVRTLPLWLASAFTVVLLPAPLAGQYAVARRARDGKAASVGVFLRGTARHYRPLLSTTLRMRVVAAVLGALTFGLLLAGETALTYRAYAGGAAAPSLDGELARALLLAVAGGTVARLPLVWHDLPVLFGEASPAEGWRASLRVAVRRPRFLVGHGARRALLASPAVVLPAAAVALFGDGSGTAGASPPAFVGVVVAAGVGVTVASALVAAHHVGRFDGEVAGTPAVTGPVGGGMDAGQAARVVAALALVVVVVAGGVAVRVGDVQPAPDGLAVDRSMDGDAIVAQAREALGRESVRAVTTMNATNASTDVTERTVVWRTTVDRDDRQVTITKTTDPADRPPSTGSRFFSESTRATDTGTVAVARDDHLLTARADDWFVLRFGGYSAESTAALGARWLPSGAEWTVREWRADSVVVTATVEDPDDDVADVRVRVVVDRATGRPRSVVERYDLVRRENGTVVERTRVTRTTTFEAYGDADAARPAGIGPRTPVEWLWDLVYY